MNTDPPAPLTGDAEILSAAKPVTPAPESENEDDYFYLSKPILIAQPGKDDRQINRLLINPKKLGGRGFFSVVNDFSKRFPDEYRVAFNLYNNVNFVQLVIARLNKIVPEDLYKAEYADLPLLMLRASAFHFSGGSKPLTSVNGETPETN